MLQALFSLLPWMGAAQAYFIMSQKILETTRLDPIVNPGSISSHVHSIAGGSNFAESMTYGEMQQGACTTAAVSVDHSNYWAPQLYYYNPNASTFSAIPAQYMNAYYLPRPGTKDTKVYAFPDGLRMISGNPNRRTLDTTDPDDLAITYVCLDFTTSHTGDPAWDQRNSFFAHNCPTGMRAQVNFPNCWDGVNLDSSDHKSHMAWPDGGVNGGDCPTSHPVHLVSLFYEFIWEVQNFPYNTDGSPTWVLANGDTTGYGLHADFINGWPSLVNGSNVLQEAIDQCNQDNGVGGNLQDCPPFVPYLDYDSSYACQPQNALVDEDVGFDKPLTALPGNNPIWIGNGSKPTVAGYNETAALYNTSSEVPSGWSAVGCIAEGSSGRALSAKSFSNANMTRAVCMDFCASYGLPLAGVEYGDECYCDSAMRNGATNTTLLADDRCGMACANNSYENCGGSSTLNLFVNPSLFNAPALPAGWSANGCMTEATSGRALSGYSISSSSMTPATCIAACAAKGYLYAGTEYASECYCGNSFNAGSKNASSTDCNMACSGSIQSTCGGSSRLTTYLNVALLNQNTSSPTSTVSTSKAANTTVATSTVANSTVVSATVTTNSTKVATSTIVANATVTSSSTASVNTTTKAATSTTVNATSTTATSTAATTTAAVPSNVPSGWSYVGCQVDSSTRALSGYSTSSSSMTWATCTSICSAKGYLYAGVEYGDECYCGATLGGSTAVASACNMACAGDKNSTCGGSSRLTVFKNTNPPATGVVPSGWSSIGCIDESSSGRIFSTYSFTSSAMNYSLCLNACAAKSLPYAGIEYASQCYCGAAPSVSIVNASSSDCNMACSGDVGANCGGPNRLTAFYNPAAAPAPVVLPTGWSALGCYVDQGSPRILNGYAVSTSSMNWTQCIGACSAKGYSYAGVEYADECYCGNSLNATAATSGCNMACAGDSFNVCGGSNRMNVFQGPAITTTTSSSTTTKASTTTLNTSSTTPKASTTSTITTTASSATTAKSSSTTTSSSTTAKSSTTTAAAAASTSAPAGWTAFGCYVDSGSPRAIGVYAFTSGTNMTTEICVAGCAAKGFTLAGTEWSSECYCSNGTPASLTPAATTDCTMKCSGNSSEICGDSNRLNVYQLTSAITSSSGFSSTTTTGASTSITTAAKRRRSRFAAEEQ